MKFDAKDFGRFIMAGGSPTWRFWSKLSAEQKKAALLAAAKARAAMNESLADDIATAVVELFAEGLNEAAEKRADDHIEAALDQAAANLQQRMREGVS